MVVVIPIKGKSGPQSKRIQDVDFSKEIALGTKQEQQQIAAANIKRILGGGGGSSKNTLEQLEKRRRELRLKQEQTAKAEAEKLLEKARQQAIKQIQQKRLSQIRQAKSSLQRKNLLLKQSQEIRNINTQIRTAKKQSKKIFGEIKKVFTEPEIKEKLLRKAEKKTPKQKFIELIKPSPEEKLLRAVSIGETLKINYLAFKELPNTIKSIVQNPSLLKSVPSAIKQDVNEFRGLVRASPTSALGKIGTELLLLKGTSKGLKALSRGTELASARLSTKFVGKAKVGNKLRIVTKAGKEIDLDVVGRIGSKGLPRETLSKQISRAGKKVTGISTQADELVGFVKRKRIVRKPIPNEAKLASSTKKLLKKFDDGRINKNELVKLDKAIQKQSGKGILERSFFVDPEARIRPSRIGLEKEASISDILKKDVTFKKQRPQILLFSEAKVEKLPKSLKKVGKKLANNKPLTKLESDAFLKFQLKKSGKFKPIGFASREPEITLAPGEIIKREKKVGVTIINRRKVSIVEAKTIKPSKKLNKLLTKYKRGIKLNSKERKELNKLFKKETNTGFKVTSPKVSYKRVPVKRIGLSNLTRVIPRISRPSKTVKISRPSKTRRVSKPSKPRKILRIKKSAMSRAYSPTQLKKPAKVSKPSKPSKLKRAGKALKPRKIIGVGTDKLKKKQLKPQPVFNVYGKSKGKFIKLNTKPLTRTDALSRGAFAVDRTTAKTFKIIPAGKTKKAGSLLKDEKNYFNRQGYKLREYKVKRGRKFVLKNQYIEKRKYGIDTRGEKRGLSLARFLNQRKIKQVPLRKVKRKISSSQKKVLLQRLKKARAVRMKNLKRRKSYKKKGR